MKSDNILEIGIDISGKLYVKPEKERFTMIYRLANGIQWDDKGVFLYSPKPREWSYFDWYKHIVSVIEIECNIKLNITNDTIWNTVPESLKNDILNL